MGLGNVFINVKLTIKKIIRNTTTQRVDEEATTSEGGIAEPNVGNIAVVLAPDTVLPWSKDGLRMHSERMRTSDLS
jgi:hypothetical protein